MKNCKLNLNEKTEDRPVTIEVCVELEKMITEALLKVTNKKVAEIDQLKSYYQETGINMVRFTLPELDNEQLSLVSWHAGEWYVRMHPLLNVNLN